MRWLSALIAPLLPVTLAIGCNTVDPDQCWLNTSGGFGGGGTIPIGAGVGATSSGDFGSPPDGPLDYDGTPNPCIEPQSPCNEKCLADYEAEAAKCGKMGESSARLSCQGVAHDRYKQCGAACSSDPGEICKQLCDRQYEDCCKTCNTLLCFGACMAVYSKCLKDC